MKNKVFKKVITAALASACVFSHAAMLSSCTTDHPEVKMKLSFNGKTYTLNYELYRKIAPSTVKHFLELADEEFYDDMCVHNYSESKWYTGGYTCDADSEDFGGLVEVNYFEEVKDLGLTATVWQGKDKENPTHTLYGEFSANGFKVKAGTLDQSFGSLTMYYTSKADVVGKVYTKRSDGKGTDMKDYKLNSATSLFYISVASSTSAASANYCTFATLKDGSKDDLKALKEAIANYISSHKVDDEDFEFAPVVEEIPSDAGDSFIDGGEERTYSVPVEPIVIKSIRVTKY